MTIIFLAIKKKRPNFFQKKKRPNEFVKLNEAYKWVLKQLSSHLGIWIHALAIILLLSVPLD